MEETKRSIRIANNRFPFERFVRLFALIEILLVFIYTKYIAAFSVHGSRIWLLVSAIAVFAGSSLVLSWKLERNWLSLLSGTILPVLVFEVISMWKYSLVIRTASMIIGIIAIALGIIWASKKVRKLKRADLRREVLIIKSARASRMICCLFLAGVCIYGRALIAAHYAVSYSDIAYSLSESYNDIPDYENSLAANIETVARIDPDGGWGSLTIDEKNTVLETVVRIECRYLGMRDSAPSLELAYLEEGLLGQYDDERDVITLSYNYVVDSEASGYSVVQVLCHELYHRYQRYQVDLLQAIRDNDETAKYADLLFLDNAGSYEKEFSNYLSPDDDSVVSYYLYSSQELERDAEKYGNASVVDYYEQIRSYLSSNQ